MKMSPQKYMDSNPRGTVDFPLTLYHQVQLAKEHDIVCHWHDDCEIMLVHEGEMEYYLDSEPVRILRKGEAAFIAPGRVHAGMSNNIYYDCIVFDGGMLLKNRTGLFDEMLSAIIESRISVTPFFEENDPIITNILEPLFQTLNQPTKGSKLITVGYLYTFFGEIYAKGYYDSTSIQNDSSRRIQKIKKAMKMIHESYAQPLTRKDIADAVGLNERYFGRLFLNITRLSPMQYLQQYRIKKACELLEKSDFSISQIAMMCGFSSPEYFSRVFRQYKNIPPKDYCHTYCEVLPQVKDNRI